MTVDEHLSAILQAGLDAVDPARRVAEALAEEPWLDAWAADVAGGRGRTLLVAVGKAAAGMARGALAVLGDAVDEGVVLVPEPGPAGHGPGFPPTVEVRTGGHPLPTAAGVEAARRVAELVGSAGTGDRVLVLLSGGGSALLTLPRPEVALDDLVATTRLLLERGIPIAEINLVRRHLERLKGGGMAALAPEARVLGLVLSDVPGDDVRVVASGPLSPDGSTPRDAEILLRRRGLWERLPAAVRDSLQERRDEPPLRLAGEGEGRVRVVAGGGRAVDGAAARARALGYRTHVLTRTLTGEARRAGRGLARVGLAVRDGVGPVRPPACLVAAGETTVQVAGRGRGGRNQEVALAAALALEGEPGVWVASLGTDGVDGPTDAAGGWADGSTAERGRTAGVQPEAALADNDAYTFLEAAGGLLRTGPTGTNVADLMVVLVASTPPIADTPGA